MRSFSLNVNTLVKFIHTKLKVVAVYYQFLQFYVFFALLQILESKSSVISYRKECAPIPHWDLDPTPPPPLDFKF